MGQSNLQAWVDSDEYKNYKPELMKREKDSSRTGPVKINDRFFLPPKSNAKHSEKFKILKSFFLLWASENGYKFVKVKGLLGEGDFFKLIDEGQIMGDKGVLQSHGEWPHAIQQFIITEYYKGNYKPKLSHTPVELYTKLGKKESQSEEYPTGFWDDLYDQQEETRPQDDFRSPERLMDFIKSDEAESRYPLLSACVQREDFGFKKREKNKTGGRYYHGDDKITRLEEEDINSLFGKK